LLTEEGPGHASPCLRYCAPRIEPPDPVQGLRGPH